MLKQNYSSVFKFFVWLNIYIHLVFSSYAFMPVSLAYSKDQPGNDYQLSDNQRVSTTGYIVGYGETVESIAKKINIDVETLRRLNQKTAFLKNFDHLQKGDMLLVPQALSANKPERDSRFSGYAQQIGTFLANGGRSSDAQSIATNFLAGKANSSIEQWLNRYGTARFQLNIDNNFSLKNSQFEMLLPVWDDGKRLFFTQGSVHRTDSRIQANLGLGARYSASDYMIGSNVFWDYDISHYHSRMGVGIEYWRDYLKLSANGYFRISSWRSSPDIEDYDERPANGWDVRAEGYLPFYPQAGLKLNYEQYYGNEVALLGKDNRCHNPYAVTFGASYTPFPLMTFNVDHRRGASGDNNTRFGAQFTYKFGVPLERQLDPDAVNDMRTVAGSRYDLVNRNNNIILEYRRQEVIRLFMANYIAGLPGEKHSLAASVEAKHDLAHVDWAAPALLAAGGSVIAGASLTDYTVVLPPYHVGGEENNTYLITATAADKKGNVSRQTATQIVVKAPVIDNSKSTFLPVESTLTADDTSSVTLTLMIRDSQGRPADINISHVDLSVSGKKSAKITDLKRTAVGTYELTVTAGTDEETVIFTPSVNGIVLPVARVIILPGAPSGGQSTFTASPSVVIADNSTASTLTFVAKDTYGNVVGNIADRLSFAVADSSGATLASGAVSISSISESGTKGTYTATLKGTLAGTYTMKPEYDSASIGALKTQVELTADGIRPSGDDSIFTASPSVILADNSTASTLTFVAKDTYGNAVGGIAKQLSFAVTDSRGASPAAGAVSVGSITESGTKGTYTATLKGTLAGTYTSKPTYEGAAIGTLKTQVELTADGTKPGGDGHSTFTASPNVILADNSATSTLTFVAKDTYGNAVGGIAKQLSFAVTDSKGGTPAAGAVSVGSITESSTKGTYTATLKGTLANTYTIKPSYNGTLLGTLKTQVELTADAATAVVAELKLQDNTIVKTANGTDSFDYVAMITDKNGNRVSNVTVTWFKNTENADFSKQTSTTDANGQATVSLTSTNSGGAMNVQVAAKANADTKQVDADKTVSFVGYRFVLETDKKVIAVDGTSQYNAVAIPSDNSGRVVLTSEAEWSTGDASVATSVGGGLMRGKSAGTADIIATGTYKGIAYRAVEKLTVRAPVFSPVYGDQSGQLEEHIIRPPSYLLATRCGFIVDAVGTLEGITGGGGGDAKEIQDMDKVTAITMHWGRYIHAPNGTTIGKIEISYSDGRPVQSCGGNQDMTDVTSQTYYVPAGMMLEGVRVNAGQYVWGIQWLAIDAAVKD